MAVVARHGLHEQGRSVHRAWTAMALTPVGLVLALVVALVLGSGDSDGNPFAGAALAVIAFAAPTAAVHFGFDAVRARERSARLAAASAIAVLLVVLLAVPLLVVSTPAVFVAVAVYAVVILGRRWMTRRR